MFGETGHQSAENITFRTFSPVKVCHHFLGLALSSKLWLFFSSIPPEGSWKAVSSIPQWGFCWILYKAGYLSNWLRCRDFSTSSILRYHLNEWTHEQTQRATAVIFSLVSLPKNKTSLGFWSNSKLLALWNSFSGLSSLIITHFNRSTFRVFVGSLQG